MVLFAHPYFTGPSKVITSSVPNLLTYDNKSAMKSITTHAGSLNPLNLNDKVSSLKFMTPSDTVPVIAAYKNAAWGSSDCNPSVDNVLDAIDRLPTSSTPLRFIAPDADVQFEGAKTKNQHHWQSIQRLMCLDKAYFAISMSSKSGKSAEIHIIEFPKSQNGFALKNADGFGNAIS